MSSQCKEDFDVEDDVAEDDGQDELDKIFERIRNRMMNCESRDIINQVNDILRSAKQIESQLLDNTIEDTWSDEADSADGAVTRVFPNEYVCGSKWTYPRSRGYMHDFMLHRRISKKESLPPLSPLYNCVRHSFSNFSALESGPVEITPEMIEMFLQRCHYEVPFFNHAEQTYSSVKIYLFSEEHLDFCTNRIGLNADIESNKEYKIQDKHHYKYTREMTPGLLRYIPKNVAPYYRSTRHPLYPEVSSEEPEKHSKKRKSLIPNPMPKDVTPQYEPNSPTSIDMECFNDPYMNYHERVSGEITEISSPLEIEPITDEIPENKLESILADDTQSTSSDTEDDMQLTEEMESYIFAHLFPEPIQLQFETPNLSSNPRKRNYDDDVDNQFTVAFERQFLQSELCPSPSASFKSSEYSRFANENLSDAQIGMAICGKSDKSKYSKSSGFVSLGASSFQLPKLQSLNHEFEAYVQNCIKSGPQIKSMNGNESEERQTQMTLEEQFYMSENNLPE